MSTPALKLTAYAGERDRVGGRLVADALLDVFGRRGLAASVLLRGAAGFGAAHHLRSDRILTLSEDLPVVAVAVDAADRVSAALDEVGGLMAKGLVTVERALLAGPDSSVSADAKLTLYAARGASSHRDAIAALQRHRVAGATAFTAVDGTLHGERRRARLLGRNAGVPVMVVSVGDAESLARAQEELRRHLPDAVTTIERVRVLKRDGVRLADPAFGEGGDAWSKVTVYASEQARHGGHALGEQLVVRLRRAGAAGVTLLRGTWGYHGAHAPHGDRVRGLRRHVPLVAVAVDAPERARRWWPVVDELTDEAGLVTVERVPRRL